MKSISIDLETRSSVDISKSGVYRYAEAEDFAILLFGYAVDGGTVEVIDIVNGEQIPQEILDALSDDRVIKWAFNANFERVCLSHYLSDLGIDLDPFRDNHPLSKECSRFLSPHSWRCTMVWSAYMGLPLSLASVGRVLGLEEQKMMEGKALIRYFSTPPFHEPTGERWELFKDYNRRDVEVEMAIQKRLSKYPVPQSVWDEYVLDQEINDRGIRLDMPLVENAVKIDAHTKEKLTDRLKTLTGLENPNSVAQMKAWLKERGVETESLDKKAVAALLANVPAPLKEVLELRQQLAKSSVKKYQAMQNTICSDGRARGMFQFYGANRTGRWCLTGDHEVLTKEGWIRLDKWNGSHIAVWNANNEMVSFQSAKALCFEYSGKMYTYRDTRIDQCSTPDHKMRVQRRYGYAWEDMTVEEMSKCRPAIPIHGYRYHRGCANPTWLRVLIMTQADGFYTSDGSVRFNFKKERKIARCKMLLRRAEIMFAVHTYKDVTNITIPARNVPLWLRQFRTKTFGFWLLDENPDIFFDELPHWDGYCPAPNSIQYSTCNKQNADIVQALAHMSSRAAVIKLKHRNLEKHPNWNQAYVVDIWLTPKNCHEIRIKPEASDFSGSVYCAETPTGYFLVRRNGKVWITGNSGRHIQLQNLPQNHLTDLKCARDIVRQGNYEALEMIYGFVPDVLSQLIRTAFIPKAGRKFIAADFAAIEARVLSWLVKERWRMDVFEGDGDIYCATAGRMFHCNVVKHGENGHLRQKGKQAELACGYGGSVGALKAFGALESGMNEDELKPLVDAWRAANPNIVEFWWAVDRAAKDCIKERSTKVTHGIRFIYQSGMMFIELPSGRRLSYVKPRIGENQFGGESVTYMGLDLSKKWARIESYGPKLVENITQAISRDILCYAMQTLRTMDIVAHVHDELIIECDEQVSLPVICEQMERTPPWAEGLLLRAEGFECRFYQKD
ncbi:DNA polymerase [uncultured Selenomonas sp.]|uniref:DNA polymerase n=1 Tax=uncultured Selenomonas sp. TaxID=159275 RepID=UPI0028DB6E30|nr:DNA polymerase [uncultured Selenomonas sp.]